MNPGSCRLPRLAWSRVFAVCLLMCAAALAGVSPGVASSGKLGPLYVEPDQGYAPIDTLISSAQHTLDMTMYELKDPDAQKALIADAARGVTVRVILDKQFSGGPFNAATFTA